MSLELCKSIQESAADTGAATVILADVSGSMRDAGKIGMLRQALATIWPEARKARLFAFADSVTACSEPSELPDPYGGTEMDLALDRAAALMPAKVIVISDGLPSSEERTLDAASRVPGVIDVVYCGPESDRRAVAFMRRLGSIGGGQTVIRDIAKTRALLAPVLREMLALPNPIAL